MQLFEASMQWAFRPADQRFSSIEEMNAVCQIYKEHSYSGLHNTKSLRVEAIKDSRTNANELVVNLDDVPTKLTNFGFNQLCHRIGAPPDYIRTIGKNEPELAAKCMNYGLEALEPEEFQSLIYRPYEDNYGKLCRSIMTPQYKRIWNSEITERLLQLADKGWRVPPARPAFQGQIGSRKATAADVLHDNQFNLSIKVGDLIAPAGLYASDHDMFAFFVNTDYPIDDGTGHPMYRGFFVWNSEVGSSVLGIQIFLFQTVCGNHICYGVSNVQVLKIKHIGVAKSLFEKEFQNRLFNYINTASSVEENLITKARNFELGKTRLEIIDKLTAIKNIHIPKIRIGDAYDQAELDEAITLAPPTSCWGLVQGLTRISQESRFADEGVRLDQEAGKVLALAA